MAQEVDNAFVKQYEKEVHEAYQRRGSKLRNTVRVKNGVVGSSTTFQKVGKGAATTKSRHGVITPMNQDHTPVECILADYYAGDWVDKLDELKTNIDERQVVANGGAYALGRKTDDLILAQLAAATTYQTAAASTGMSVDKFLAALTALGDRDVAVDEADNMFAVVGWKEWSQLMGEVEFASADYVPPAEMPFKGAGLFAKRFSGVMVMPHSIIVPDVSDITTNFMYHRTSVGHAVGQDVTSDITWHGDRAAHFINNMMSQGSKLIDTIGVQQILCDRSP
jgi:hypothetical protein